jgi:hypothetical protein
MNKILKEPLFHFLLVGLLLFVVYEFTAGDGDEYDSRTIVVDRDALLTFVQFRSRAFEPRVAAERLDSMSDEELDRLVAEYVREEALHREAVALGVDQNDYIIKQRMIQSIRFITNGFVTANVEVTDEDVAEYFAANREDYYIPPVATFTHVFFSTESRSLGDAMGLANTKLAELNRDRVIFSDATRHGERFPYFTNYVERDAEFIASHFGRQMAEAVFALDADESEWRGPFVSPYGVHLVLIPRSEPGRYPLLEDVAGSVREDAEREALEEAQEAAIMAIVDTYEVRRELRKPAE